MGRATFSTTLDAELLHELKVTAARLDRPLNQLLEDAVRKLLNELSAADPDAAIFAARVDEPVEDSLREIEARLDRILASRV